MKALDKMFHWMLFDQVSTESTTKHEIYSVINTIDTGCNQLIFSVHLQCNQDLVGSLKLATLIKEKITNNRFTLFTLKHDSTLNSVV